jgi:hypothetical protein
MGSEGAEARDLRSHLPLAGKGNRNRINSPPLSPLGERDRGVRGLRFEKGAVIAWRCPTTLRCSC